MTYKNTATMDIQAMQRTGADLRQVRETYGLSQEEIAAALGVTGKTVSNRENRLKVSDEIYRQHRHAAAAVFRERERNLPPG